MDPYDPASSSGWLHHLHHIWPLEAASRSRYLWLEYLLIEMHGLKKSHDLAGTYEERQELLEQYFIVLEEFEWQLETVESIAEAHYAMKNLPFHDPTES